ncbi:cysteine hydrolase [Synechococcus sp. MIT S9503]|uniref:cysteine hydrolase n=1 Tax=Synechococcus sp. MIT S9503 TaxID=3082547 RepID=UPI0039A55D1C
MAHFTPSQTALVLIGFQKDYFDPKGALYSVVEESHRVSGTLEHTIETLNNISESPITIVNTPIVFSETYKEIENPTGILKAIKEIEAFKEGTEGAEVIAEIKKYGERIKTIPGKKGFNAFSNTDLKKLLTDENINQIVIAGCVSSLCINATALYAKDQGYEVTILSDCTSSRTPLEQEMFCDEIFPLFADVITHTDFIDAIKNMPD